MLVKIKFLNCCLFCAMRNRQATDPQQTQLVSEPKVAENNCERVFSIC